jgi:hypothetical protein
MWEEISTTSTSDDRERRAIRNAALRAAYRAAQAETEITQEDLIASAEQESESSGALTRSSGR